MTKIDATNVSTKDLATILGMTRDGVTRLCRAGVLSQNGVARGKYDLREAVSSYAKHTRETHGETADTRLASQRERKLRLQNDKTEAGLVRSTDAAQIFAAAHSLFVSLHEDALEGIAAEVAKTDSPHKVRKILTDGFWQISQRHNDEIIGPINEMVTNRRRKVVTNECRN
ncbi:MAG: hypothetical protein IH806_11400 [Proteobacteria bacterium]|nr:hypothetical protein [Pseudomonadota bacterium]